MPVFFPIFETFLKRAFANSFCFDFYFISLIVWNGVGSGIYSEKLDLKISLRHPDYCSVFQMEVKAIYRADQWVLVNYAPFTCISIFSDSLAAIKFLSGFVNNSRIVREYRRCLDLLSGRFTRGSLVCVSGHNYITGNYRADELARACAILPESSSIKLGVPFA